MRYFASVIVLLALPVSAAAQHSPSLPPIGLPLAPIGLPPPKPRPWDGRPHFPWWETRQLPPWEGHPVRRPVNADVGRRGVNVDRRGHRNNTNVVYLWAPYPVAVYQEPQVIVVQQPPVTRIVEVEVPVVEVPAREPEVGQVPRPFVPEPPPYEPTGDRTLYVIPGCYVGNVPPKDVARLPANCDVTKVTTYVP
jgi:hypothetical protein